MKARSRKYSCTFCGTLGHTKAKMKGLEVVKTLPQLDKLVEDVQVGMLISLLPLDFELKQCSTMWSRPSYGDDQLCCFL